MNRPVVCLSGNPDGVNIRLVESLISNFCFVKILSRDKELWGKYLSHIQQKNAFQIIDPAREKEFVVFEYLILDNLDLTFSLDEVLSISRLAAVQSARILVILPYLSEGVRAWQKREKIRGGVLKKIPEAGIVYVGELYGPRYLGREKSFITRNITTAAFDKEIEEGDVSLFPVSIEAFCRYLTRSMFSFGPYGRELALYSGEIQGSRLLDLLRGQFDGAELVPGKLGDERHEALGVKEILIKEDFEKRVAETILWFKKNASSEKSSRSKWSKNLPSLKKGAFVGILLLFLAPYLFGLFSMASAALAFNALKKGKPDSAKRSLILAKDSSENSHKFFSVYSRIPLVSAAFKPFVKESEFFSKVTEIGLSGVETLEKTQELTRNILGEEPYDPTPITEEISHLLDNLYQETSFLESEVKEVNQSGSFFLARFLKEKDLEKIRLKTLNLKAIFEKAPEILGKGTPKTYLVLFQNNMELRPGGGFIGSFALVSFDAGRLTDINVMDVYAADGQLKGHVEPPAPIRKYLGEANWFLRDSNWDPDFPTSAARAEWFLDKEMDRPVNGVVGVDLEIVKGFLQATGPVVLSDFNQTFDYKNLYERLQTEVESDFFPGSQKKAGVLTALVRELMNRLGNLQENEYVPIARQIYENLEGRHIQIFFNEESVQEAFSNMGYTGEVSAQSDWLSAVDANVGVTKANYFIERQYKLDVTLGEGVVKKNLEIIYQNNANPALGLSGRYRTYTRVFVPAASSFEKIKIENVGVIVETDPEVERAEDKISAGVNLEISPGQTKKLIFSWEMPIAPNPSGGKYELLVRKQAGTLSDPIQVNILTPREAGSYNTLLARDFFVSSSY